MSGRRIEYWADYICPWCYLALDRADHLRNRHGAEVVWHPYELHPEIPAGGEPAPSAHRSRDTAEYLRGALREAGFPVAPRLTWSNSRRALALSWTLRTHPRWGVLHRGLYTAYWAQGRDLGDPAELAAIGVESGISAAEVEAAVAEPAGGSGVDASRERALDLGIAATPGWHFGEGIVLTGAHPRAAFDRVMARAT